MFRTAQKTLKYALVLILATALFPVRAYCVPRFRVLYSFLGGTDGGSPQGPLVFDSQGNLYGVTRAGGSTVCNGGCGTVFQLVHLSSGAWQKNLIYSFTGGHDGSSPNGGLVFDNAGNLYGTAHSSTTFCGTVFELSAGTSGWTEQTLHEFTGQGDGCLPTPGLTIDGNGNLFGTTEQAGCGSASGTVFELAHSVSGWTETILHCFTGFGGQTPMGGVALDSAGNIYGTTSVGGAYGGGTIFKLTCTQTGCVAAKLYDFTGGDNGTNPSVGVRLDSAGNLYGTAGGGADNVGLVYKLSPTSGLWRFSVLHTFTGGGDGGNPSNTLWVGPAGTIYGTTMHGGGHQWGTVFKLVRSNTGHWTETVLRSFSNGTDGAEPSGVILDAFGNLYGTAGQPVYELRP